MFDIMFDIELNKIKKRYGNIVSFNIGQTCGFSFMNDEFTNGKTVAAVFIRGEKDFVVEMEKFGNEYKCNFPDELCDCAEAYKLVVIAFTNDAEAPSDFRSTMAYYGTVEDSGCDGTKFVPNHTETIFERIGENFVLKLRESLETATGESQGGKTWDELNNTVAELPILKEEQIQELGGWELVKAAMAGVTADRHNLFRNAPVDENGAPRYFRLPYIYTPKMAWIAHDCLISTYLTDFGVDVSSAVSLGSNQAENTFSPLPNLQHLVLTGNANSPTLQSFMYANSALRYLKMDAPSEDALRDTPNYYQSAFSNCNSLEIIDCELDFTGQTNVKNTFYSCYKLKHLRIKPFTLSTSLSLGTCRSLHHNDLGDYDTLISILNGITNDREVAKNITITFSNEITDFTVGMYQFWMKNVYFRDGSYLYYSKLEEVEEGYVYLELTLYEAFINKGVTIAWV